MRCLWVFIMVLCLEWSSWHEVCVAFPFWHVLLMFRTLLMRGWIFTKLLNYILASPNCCETWWSCSWCHYEAIKYLTCSFGHVYHPMLNFVYLRSSRLYFFAFLAWFMHSQQGGDIWACFGLLKASRRFSGGFVPFWALLCTDLTGWGHRSDWSECWPCSHVGHWSNQRRWPVWPVRAELLQLLYFVKWFTCIRLGGACMCEGGALCGFRALDRWIVLFT
jgi:hypothetical protein